MAGQWHNGGQEIRDRTFQFAVRVVRLCQHLDARPGVGRALARQLIRSGTAIGANLEEAKAGTSRADFAAKCDIALKEARETHYWLRLLAEAGTLSPPQLEPLRAECAEISRVLGAITASARRRRRSQR